MIELKNVSKSFNTKVIDNVNIKLYYGNIYLLKGISGSGKTTLLNLISGLDKEYEGSILVDGKELKEFSKKEYDNYLYNIGYMLQKSLLYKDLTLLDNLLMLCNDKTKIEDLAKKFNVYNLLNKYPQKISGGERQRVALIRALICDSKIIILDEPTSNLDYNNSLIFAKFLKEIDKSDKLIIISSHKDIYDDLVDVIINIEYGRIKENGINKIERFTDRKVIRNNKKLTKSAWRTRKKQGFFRKIFLSVMFLVIFLTISFSLNFKNEYVKYRMKETPFNIIDIDNNYIDNLENIIDRVYDNYYYKDDTYEVHPLLEDNETTIDEAIIRGRMPKSNDEVLVNDFNKNINDIIVINNKEYKVVGIVKSQVGIVHNSLFYVNIKINNSVFMKYDELKSFGEIKRDFGKMVVIKDEYLLDLYTNDLVPEKMIINSMVFNTYQYEVKSIVRDVKSMVEVSFIIIFIVLLLTLLFIGNQISLELFYRKKELGYLQLFHFSKEDISWFITIEYIGDFLNTYLLSFIIYIVLSIVCYYVFSFNLFINGWLLLSIFIFFLLYFYILINLPLNKYLKYDIIKLIK